MDAVRKRDGIEGMPHAGKGATLAYTAQTSGLGTESAGYKV